MEQDGSGKDDDGGGCVQDMAFHGMYVCYYVRIVTPLFPHRNCRSRAYHGTRLLPKVDGSALLVKNAETGETEILVQDFRKILYLLNEKGAVLWKRNMQGLMVGAPKQIDIYNNNRLQYAWHEGIKLHLIDKLGRNVPAFPVKMTDTVSQLQGISVLDPLKNKDYLFAGCDERGRLFVLNKRVQWVQGWNPKRLTYRLGTPLQAVRVKNDTYFIAIQENGQIYG